MIKVNQQNSDKMWQHYQVNGIEVFDLSYPRLRFLAKCCLQGSMVLNVGVGSGYLESILMRRGVVAHSIDPSELTINRLNEEQGMKGRAKQGYCHAIPFPDGFFDCVIMSEVLEHIPKDFLDASLREVRRVLKSGGRWILQNACTKLAVKYFDTQLLTAWLKRIRVRTLNQVMY
jgi:ubiquinone/menaquinone biosynthesis C-methylase UbiE